MPVTLFGRIPQGVNYYWTDKGSTGPAGPFPNVFEACRHYEYIRYPEAPKAPEDLPPLITVDFLKKKRI